MAEEKVWLDYTQAELNDQYNQRTLVPDANAYMARHAEASAAVRASQDCRLDVAYGPTDDERLDIFPAAGEGGTPVVVYYHGGAWTRWHKDNNSYQAPAFTGTGVAFVSVNFALVPAVSLDELVRQCRAALAWTHDNAESFGADPTKLYVAGHSSGAHVAGLLAVTDWTDGWRLPVDAVKGVCAASGMYDLDPVRLSSRNEYLHLDDGAVDRLSAMRHIPDRMPPMIVAYGGDELQEFRRQSQAWVQELTRRGFNCREMDMPGKHHFLMAEQFAEADGPLLGAFFEMIGVGT